MVAILGEPTISKQAVAQFPVGLTVTACVLQDDTLPLVSEKAMFVMLVPERKVMPLGAVSTDPLTEPAAQITHDVLRGLLKVKVG